MVIRFSDLAFRVLFDQLSAPISPMNETTRVVQPLNDAHEYNTWAYILTGSFSLEDDTAKILTGKVKLSIDGEGKVVAKDGPKVLCKSDTLICQDPQSQENRC